MLLHIHLKINKRQRKPTVLGGEHDVWLFWTFSILFIRAAMVNKHDYGMSE
jgi:hypothetical protein